MAFDHVVVTIGHLVGCDHPDPPLAGIAFEKSGKTERIEVNSGSADPGSGTTTSQQLLAQHTQLNLGPRGNLFKCINYYQVVET